MLKNIIANWSISLDTKCPSCSCEFDLMRGDYFNDYGISPIEHHTNRTIGFEVTCPECSHEFLVDFDY